MKCHRAPLRRGFAFTGVRLMYWSWDFKWPSLQSRTLSLFSPCLFSQRTQVSGYPETALNYFSPLFLKNDIRRGGLKAFSKTAVMAEWSTAPPETQTVRQEATEDARMTHSTFFLLSSYTVRCYCWGMQRLKNSLSPLWHVHNLIFNDDVFQFNSYICKKKKCAVDLNGNRNWFVLHLSGL